jgi:hypothetical protein
LDFADHAHNANVDDFGEQLDMADFDSTPDNNSHLPGMTSSIKMLGGFGLTVVGFVTAPWGAPLIGVGIGLMAEGVVTGMVDAMGGDTGSLPYGPEMIYDIGVGIYDYNYGDQGCSP